VTEAVDREENVAAPTGPLNAFLDLLEAPAPSPCGGTAAAVAAAMAASLVTMVARASPAWDEAPGIASQSRALRARLVELGSEDASAFAQVIATMRDATGTPEQRDFALGTALILAAEVPLRIAEASADVADLAALASSHGAHQLQADATAAAALAEAATRAATHLVDINLATVPGGRNWEKAAALAEAAAAARARALGGT
jgi:formiminotetrahydrofolate cyclodeaminase